MPAMLLPVLILSRLRADMSIFLVFIPIAQDEKECNSYLFLSELFPLPPGSCLAVIKLFYHDTRTALH